MTSWAGEVIGRVELGDQRLVERLRVLAEALGDNPGASIPEASAGWAGTKAAYAFLDNPMVEVGKVVAGMAQASLGRCQTEEVVLALQDTTSLDYTSHPQTQGLGPLENPTRRGLFVHTTLAASLKGVPLGLVAQEVWAREPEERGKRHRRKALPVEAKESAKWLRGLVQTEQRLGQAGPRVISVADREADVYELFSLADQLQGDWLIRARHDRNLKDEPGHLLRVVEAAPVEVCTVVELPRTDEREARKAKLEVRRAQVVLVPPRRPVEVIEQWWSKHPEVEHLAPRKLQPVRVGVVLVSEVGFPVGRAKDAAKADKPVRWLLLTSLAVESPEQALRCVGYYRLRWLIERYHFALKSGCRVEKLRLQTVQRLERALTVCAVVAWRLLWLTYEARAHPEAPCTEVLEDQTWHLLWAVSCPKVALPVSPPSLRTVLRQIASLGGFLGRKADGEPGVQTVWRGLRRLNDMLSAYHALQDHPELLTILPIQPIQPAQPSTDRNLMYV